MTATISTAPTTVVAIDRFLSNRVYACCSVSLISSCFRCCRSLVFIDECGPDCRTLHSSSRGPILLLQHLIEELLLHLPRRRVGLDGSDGLHDARYAVLDEQPSQF